MFALVDGNNFYVSCERVFRPALAGRPVVVLSNNDGCAISRSNEAKALGVKMAQPWFQCRHLEQEQGLVALSSNYELYGQMSERMMFIASGYAPRSEVYSIDETFLCFEGTDRLLPDLVALGRRLRAHVLGWLGIPCCVGIGPTKTLAKLANSIAKLAERKPGSYPAELAQVCDLGGMPAGRRHALFARTPVDEVWGIGRRTTAKLNAAGVRTVLEFVRLDPRAVRSAFGVALEKTRRELCGTSCFDFDDVPSPHHEIVSSRSFGSPVHDEPDLATAVSQFASRAAEKLRRQQGAAGAVVVFITTSAFRRGDRQYCRSVQIPLVRPTGDTTAIASAALLALKAAYRPGFNYAKAGVMLVELQRQDVVQHELDLGVEPADHTPLLTAVDRLNQRFGRGAVGLASAGTKPRAGVVHAWHTRFERRTPRYTTRWDEIPIARA